MKLLFNTISICQSIFIGLTFFLFSCQKTAETSKISNEEIQEPSISSLYSDSLTFLKEKALLQYIHTADILKPNVKNGIPFSQLDYDRVIAYDFMGDEEKFPNAIDENGKFIPVISKQQFLTQQQADQILSALAANSTYGESSAACFRPHLGLVFFKGNRKTDQISICLSCNTSISEIDIPARRHKVFNKGTKDEYYEEGFTSSGKAAIISLCKQIDFYYGNDKKQ